MIATAYLGGGNKAQVRPAELDETFMLKNPFKMLFGCLCS